MTMVSRQSVWKGQYCVNTVVTSEVGVEWKTPVVSAAIHHEDCHSMVTGASGSLPHASIHEDNFCVVWPWKELSVIAWCLCKIWQDSLNRWTWYGVAGYQSVSARQFRFFEGSTFLFLEWQTRAEKSSFPKNRRSLFVSQYFVLFVWITSQGCLRQEGLGGIMVVRVRRLMQPSPWLVPLCWPGEDLVFLSVPSLFLSRWSEDMAIRGAGGSSQAMRKFSR